MLGIVQALGALGTYIVTQFAAKWGYKVALVAAVVAVYASVWAIVLAAVAALVAVIPSHPFPDFLLQFFPDRAAISTAAAAYWGTAATMRSIEYWRHATGAASKAAA